jgi:hypothetical protein
VSWSLPEISNEILTSILPQDIAMFYAFPVSGMTGKIFNSEITAMFFVGVVHPASAPWRILETLLTETRAKLRIPLEIPTNQTVEVSLDTDEAWDTTQGDPESRVTTLIKKAIAKSHHE